MPRHTAGLYQTGFFLRYKLNVLKLPQDLHQDVHMANVQQLCDVIMGVWKVTFFSANAHNVYF